MAVSLTTTSGNIRNSAAVVSPGSVGTVAIRIKPNWNHNDGVAHHIWRHIGVTPSNQFLDFTKWSDNNVYVGWVNSTSGDNRIAAAATATMFTSGAWQDLVFTWSDVADTEELFAGGQSVATRSAALITETVSSEHTIGNTSSSDTQANPDGTFGDYSLWDTILTAADINAYHVGGDSKRIRPASLLRHLPILGLGTEHDVVAGDSFTVTAGTKVDNPRLVRRRPNRFWSVPSVAVVTAKPEHYYRMQRVQAS